MVHKGKSSPQKWPNMKQADLKKLAMAGASGGSGSELGRLQTRVRLRWIVALGGSMERESLKKNRGEYLWECHIHGY